jgi:hypothetical protein
MGYYGAYLATVKRNASKQKHVHMTSRNPKFSLGYKVDVQIP